MRLVFLVALLHRSLVAGLLGLTFLVPLRLLMRCLLGAGFELMDAPLLLGERGRLGRMLGTRPIATLARPIATITIAATAVAAPTTVLFAFTLRARSVPLAFSRE